MIRHSSFVIRASLTLLLCFLALPSAADDNWTLTTADFKRQAVILKSLDDSGAQIVATGQSAPSTLPWDQILQFDRGAAAVQQVRGAFALHLASGDRVGGEPVSIANDQVTWRSPAAGDLTIPLASLRAITRGQDTPSKPDPGATEDVVLLSNGDTVKGIVTALDGGKLTVKQSSGDALPVDLSSVKSIQFAAAKAAEPAAGRAFRVQLGDGSVVTAPRINLKDSRLALDLGQGGPPRPVDPVQVTLIEQLNGPVSWLSARTPVETVYHPMFDVSFPPQTDRNYRGDKLRFAGRDYARGIGVHAYCKLTYALDGTYKAFRTQYALSDDAHKGRVTVRVLLDDKVVHEARDLGPGKLSPVVLLDLGGAKTLSLEAHPGGDPSTDDRAQWHIDTQARLNWIEPALLKEKPQPTPPPAQ